MKRLLFIILLFFFGFQIMAQNKYYEQKKQEIIDDGAKVHKDIKGHTYEWTTSNKTCNGCASFYHKIMRDEKRDKHGLYYTYYVYFYNNSFYKNGVLASTYIKDIKIYRIYPGKFKKLAFEAEYILIPSKSDDWDGVMFVAAFTSRFARQVIEIAWEELIVY